MDMDIELSVRSVWSSRIFRTLAATCSSASSLFPQSRKVTHSFSSHVPCVKIRFAILALVYVWNSLAVFEIQGLMFPIFHSSSKPSCSRRNIEKVVDQPRREWDSKFLCCLFQSWMKNDWTARTLSSLVQDVFAHREMQQSSYERSPQITRFLERIT